MKIKKIAGTMAVLASLGLWLGITAANAAGTWVSGTSPISLNTQGIVGTVDGSSGDNPGSDELYFAQELLNLPANTVNFSYTDASSLVAHNYNTSSTEYGGTIVPGSSVQGANTSVAAGYDFAIAKYDGQNGGYILFYLGGEAATLPEYSYTLWSKNDPGQYQISGYTAFDVSGFNNNTGGSVPEPSTILAGALLLLPLGMSTARILRKNRTA